MNLHQILCRWGYHWWRTGRNGTSASYHPTYQPPIYIDYCRCCGKVINS